MSVVIRVENLGKKYVLNHAGPRSGDGFRHALQDALTAPFRRKSSAASVSVPQPPASEEFWALKDLSFDVKQGEVVGIIGRNGAGKSTLLKILSRITDPTVGRIGIKGRVASLLEVGTGFHPELTGRENIFLNGAILGMTRAEVKSKFDEIVDFSGVEKFLDTPVKRYSSGMYVRLAFAVAAHLEPEILIIDEVLAVGDAEFQNKCLGKMRDVATGGRTVLFVSHNTNAVETLCSSAMVLHCGTLQQPLCSPSDAIRFYRSALSKRSGSEGGKLNSPRQFSPSFTLLSFRGISADGASGGISVYCPEVIKMEIQFEYTEPGNLTLGVAIFGDDGTHIATSWSVDGEQDAWPPIRVGVSRMVVNLSTACLRQGKYTISLTACVHGTSVIIPESLESPSILVEVIGFPSTSPYFTSNRQGVVHLQTTWALES